MSAGFDLNRERDTAPRIPHRPPWLMIDKVVERDQAGTRVATERRLTSDDPLLADGFAETLMIEALAQSAACLVGDQKGDHQGYLVAVSGFQFHRRGQSGETLRLVAERTAVLGALHRFTGRVLVGDEVLCEGQMTFAIVDGAQP